MQIRMRAIKHLVSSASGCPPAGTPLFRGNLVERARAGFGARAGVRDARCPPASVGACHLRRRSRATPRTPRPRRWGSRTSCPDINGARLSRPSSPTRSDHRCRTSATLRARPKARPSAPQFFSRFMVAYGFSDPESSLPVRDRSPAPAAPAPGSPPINCTTSPAVALPSFTMKLPCISETRAPPTTVPSAPVPRSVCPPESWPGS